MKKIFVNGTFDVLHLGHLALLEYAKSLGDDLTVAIDSDDRVRAIKGNGRPINNQNERGALLAKNRDVDKVVVFDTDEDLIDLIKNSDVMVKGTDYKGKYIIGEDVCKELIFFERIHGYSSTEKIQHIISRG